MSDPTVPATRTRAAERARLVALLVLLLAAFLPWTTAQTAGGVTVPSGLERAGALVVPVLLALWGLAATLLLAGTARGLRMGSALTDTVVASAVAAFLLASHAWLPDGRLAPFRAPTLIGLVLLALLHVAALAGRSASAREVGWMRAGAGLLAGAVLLIDGEAYAGSVALWLGIAAFAATLPKARGALEALSLIGAVLAALVPVFAGYLAPEVETVGTYLGLYLWTVASLGLAALAAAGILRAR